MLALKWLTHDLSFHRKFAASADSNWPRSAMAQVLRTWQKDPALRPVRDPKLRIGFPENEGKAWGSILGGP